MFMHRVRGFPAASLTFALVPVFAACGAGASPPDAEPPSIVPTSPAGMFRVTSRFELQVPPAAGPIITTLTEATDGPDDPTRYLVERMIATLPDGTVKTVAIQAAPYVAAYLHDRLIEFAPRLVTGLHAITAGLARIAGHLGTIETLQIHDRGTAIRTITGARFELGAAPPVIVNFADTGLADIATSVRVTLDADGQVAIAGHVHRLPYGALLRLGLDRAVIASLEPRAHDLAAAFAMLLDCDRLGALIADRVGLGSPALYRAACRAGMTAIASEIAACIAAIDDTPVGLDLAGAASGIDLDGDGSMDELRAGTWTGMLTAGATRAPLGAASFTGSEHP